MTWSTLPSYTDGTVLDASKLLAIAANINESAAAKATTHCSYFTGNGTNAIVERYFGSDFNGATGTTTSGAYTNLSGGGGAGPTVTATTYSSALIHTSVQLEQSGAGSSWASFEVTGASGISPDDSRGIMAQPGAGAPMRTGVSTFISILAGGLNTFTMKYRVSSGTGTFDERHIIVMPL